MSILFSIPVHESNEVIRNTIENARKFNPYCNLVLHVSASFDNFDSTIANIEGVLINPIRFDTRHAHSQIQTHLTNFIHAINSKIDFTHFCILHTSEMFVKSGLYVYIQNLDYSVWFTSNNQPYEWSWPPLYTAYNYKIFKNLFDANNCSNYLGNLIEGNFFRKELFMEIVNWSTSNYDILNDFNIHVALEEVYFPTLANHFGKGINFSHPTTCFHHKTHFVELKSDVDDIRENRDVIFWQPNNFVYNKIPFPSTNLYSIKRINRDQSDKIRSYINNLCA